MNKNKNDINNKKLAKAIENTFNKRNTEFNINSFKEIVELLKESEFSKKIFADYQEKLEYTKHVKYEDTVAAIKEIINILESEIAVV